MHRTALVMAVLVVLAVVPAGGSAEDDGAPLADAGLDQRAEVGETVLLDGTGSRDPDGRIETYEWQIQTPDGRTVTPADPTDPRTRFVVHESGRYEVTVTITDDDGKRTGDTLYVYVYVANKGSETGAVGPSVGGGPPSAPNYGWDTLVIEGSDLTYKEDIAYRYYSVNEKLPGREIGDGQNPVNEIHEGFTGLFAGLLQPVLGTKEMNFSYWVSGETAQKMEGMADYSTGKYEDSIAEKWNFRSEAPAVLEDYVLNDARIVKGVRDSADPVKVIIHVTKNKGVMDYATDAVGNGADSPADA